MAGTPSGEPPRKPRTLPRQNGSLVLKQNGLLKTLRKPSIEC